MKAVAELGLRIPDALADELLKRVPYVSEGIRNASLTPGLDGLQFELAEGFEARASAIVSAVIDLAANLTRDHRPQSHRIVASQPSFPTSFSDDPHPLLQSRGDLIPLGRGRFAFGPRMVALMSALDARVRDIAGAFDAPQYAFPAMIGADVLDRCQYFRNFPTALTFVTHLREDHSSIRDFAHTARWTQDRLTLNPASLSAVEVLLAPSVCFHWYACLAGSMLSRETITAAGKCFRYESTNLCGLERLWDFTMREIVFAGPAEYVRMRRQACLDAGVRLLEDLQLAYEIATATDPFFVDAFSAQAAYQQGFELKFELLVKLPYSGRQLAVGSVNYHQDFFGRSFDIRAEGGPAHTGCMGFGLERLALAVVAQYGPDDRTWPVALRHSLESGPGAP